MCKDLLQKNIHDEFKMLRNILSYVTQKSRKDYFKTYFEKNLKKWKKKMIDPQFGKKSDSF